MKKVLLLLIALLLLTGCSSDNIDTISYDKLNKKIENKESFILFFDGNETLRNTLNKVLEKHDLTAYTINTNKLSKEELNDLRLKIDFETPSIVFMVNGEDPTVMSHITNQYITEKDIETRLSDMQFIK